MNDINFYNSILSSDQQYDNDELTKKIYRCRKNNKYYIIIDMFNYCSDKEGYYESFVMSNIMLKYFIGHVPDLYYCDHKKKIVIQEDLGNIPLKNINDVASINNNLHLFISTLAPENTLMKYLKCAINWNKKLHNINILQFKNKVYDKESFQKDISSFSPHLLNLTTNIINKVSSQPIVPTHTNFESSNIFIYDDSSYIINYQDISMGPILYDFVSLIFCVNLNLNDEIKKNMISEYYEYIHESWNISYLEYIEQINCTVFLRLIKLSFSKIKNYYKSHNYKLSSQLKIIRKTLIESSKNDELKQFIYDHYPNSTILMTNCNLPEKDILDVFDHKIAFVNNRDDQNILDNDITSRCQKIIKSKFVEIGYYLFVTHDILSEFEGNILFIDDGAVLPSSNDIRKFVNEFTYIESYEKYCDGIYLINADNLYKLLFKIQNKIHEYKIKDVLYLMLP